MPLDWLPFVELVQRHQRFLIMTHVRPDGDALGSESALAAHLRQHGKTVRVVVASNIPPRYRFLDPTGSGIERFEPPGENFRNIDVIIIVDTGTWNQLGDFAEFMKSMNVPKVVIDHHRTQDDLGAMRFVDTSAEAAGRLVYDACRALGQPLSCETAQALFLAVATDTGWFHHPNTTASTFALAEELTRSGAEPHRIYDELYDQSSLGRLKLIGRVLERMQLVGDGKVAYAQVFLSDFPETGAIPPDTEDLINYPRSVEGVEVAMILIEQQNQSVKVSFRSRSKVEVDRIAERYGGGGHRLASGATIQGTMEEVCQKVVAAVLQVLNPAEKAVLPTNSPAGGNQPEITAQPESKSETPVTHLEQLGEIPSATGVVVITQTMEILQIEVKPQTGLPEPTPGKAHMQLLGLEVPTIDEVPQALRTRMQLTPARTEVSMQRHEPHAKISTPTTRNGTLQPIGTAQKSESTMDTNSNSTRYTLRDLPLPAKLVITVFLLSIGLGYVSAMIQLHFKGGTTKGSVLPSLDDVVWRFSGQAPPWNKPAENKQQAEAKPEAQNVEVKKEEAPKKEPEVKKEETSKKEPEVKKEETLKKDPVEQKDSKIQFVNVPIKTIIANRCVICHSVDGGEDPKLETWDELAKYLKPTGGKSEIHKLITANTDAEWGKGSSMRPAFSTKGEIEGVKWSKAIAKMTPAQVEAITAERERERQALIKWLEEGAPKEAYDGNRFTSDPNKKTGSISPNKLKADPELLPLPRIVGGNPDPLPKVVDGKKDEPIPNPVVEAKKEKPVQNPVPAKVPVPPGELVVKEKIKNQKIQTIITQRCGWCHSEKGDKTPHLDSWDKLTLALGKKPTESKFFKLITVGDPNAWGKTEGMRPAFTLKSKIDGQPWERVIKTKSPEEIDQLKKDREIERITVIAWLMKGAPKEAYEKDDFTADVEVVLPGGPGRRRMEIDELTQTTHVHLLSFCMLWALTGIIFAFTSYPLWMRVGLAPIVLIAQVADVCCWWLARLPQTGPYFAAMILGTGAIVGMGLSAQIVLSLFNMYDKKGKAAIAALFVLAGIGAAVLAPKVLNEVKAEKPAG